MVRPPLRPSGCPIRPDKHPRCPRQVNVRRCHPSDLAPDAKDPEGRIRDEVGPLGRVTQLRPHSKRGWRREGDKASARG